MRHFMMYRRAYWLLSMLLAVGITIYLTWRWTSFSTVFITLIGVGTLTFGVVSLVTIWLESRYRRPWWRNGQSG